MRLFGLSLTTALFALLCSTGASAGGTPGQFDYWILSLSWSPEFCKTNFGDQECRQPHDFVVHGFTPQTNTGRSLSNCGNHDQVPKELLVRMLPLMASTQRIQHEWNAHGSCSGVDQQTYFELIERAHRKLEIPDAYKAPEKRITSSLDEVLRTFRSTNPDFTNEDFALNCRGSWLHEVQVCFDRNLNPRACASNVENDCGRKLLIRSH